jgi:plasmid maintenance system antidote protein VapI
MSAYYNEIDAEKASEIRSRSAAGSYSSASLAEEYGVSRVAINNIINGRSHRGS